MRVEIGSYFINLGNGVGLDEDVGGRGGKKKKWDRFWM